MYADRKSLYEKIEKERDSRVICYVTGDRSGLETRIASEVVDYFVHHLDAIGISEKISLVIYTRGGDTLAAWSIANLLRTYCDHLEVIVPSKSHSAGTLISLGANSIVMTKQATLGPIDPSVNTALNPEISGGQPNSRVPVSVEDVGAFMEFARQSLGENANIESAFVQLASKVHPIVLGNAYRARSQIRMLGGKLLNNHFNDDELIEKILSFLCSDSGSHDYTINRREAKQELGLPVEKPSWDLYGLVRDLHEDIASELELRAPFDPHALLGGSNQVNYSLTRGLVESVEGGSHMYVSEGTLNKQQVQVQPGISQEAVHDNRQFDGWRHSNG